MSQIYFIEFATPEYDEMVRLRYDVLRAPLGLSFTPEQLEKEYSDTLIGAYDNRNVLSGCLILTHLNEDVLKMRQVAVAFDNQGQGVGKELVIASENYARAKNFKKMELNARDMAIPFYLKLGYEIIGDEFEEVGIKHRKMIKNLYNGLTDV